MSAPSKSNRFALLPIFLIVAVDVLGLTIVLPILPFYAEHYGATPQVVGLLATVYALCQLLSGPLLGRWSDFTGRKPMLMISQLGTCLGFIILARANALWVIFLSRFIDGITAGNLPIAQAYISDITKPENRAKAFGVIGIAFGVGFFIGPALSAYLSSFGYSAPAWAAAGLSFCSILCTYFLLPAKSRPPADAGIETPPSTGELPPSRAAFTGTLQRQRFRSYFQRPELAELLWQFFFFGLAFSSLISGFALFAERRFTAHGHPYGAREVGFFYTYVGFLGIIVQGYLLGKLIKRFGESRLVVIGFLTQAIGYGALAFVYRAPFLFLTSIISSFGSGVLRPALTSLLTQRAGRGEQGAVLGMSTSLVSVAQVLAPLLSGFLIDHEWLSAWALMTAGFSLVGLFLGGRSLASLTSLRVQAPERP